MEHYNDRITCLAQVLSIVKSFRSAYSSHCNFILMFNTWIDKRQYNTIIIILYLKTLFSWNENTWFFFVCCCFGLLCNCCCLVDCCYYRLLFAMGQLHSNAWHSENIAWYVLTPNSKSSTYVWIKADLNSRKNIIIYSLSRLILIF